MSHSIIEVENLSKRYRLGIVGATTLSEDLRRLGRKLRGEQPAPDLNEFWALRDVSFNVQPGEVVGIIGRNGAGKSTLLKILSRITEPTSGRVRLRGRVASLLEVGTGFHPDLTGRENVFLNGAILGMKRAEIAAKFDEIVAFAEIEKFIDTPVKHYSSGMRVRLAFAVAAHLEPEILIVDEVLAVGDSRFQEKCLGKIRSIAGQKGHSVLLVSHHMVTVQRLCQRALMLQSGQLVAAPSMERAIEIYLGSANTDSGQTAGGFTHFAAEAQAGDKRVCFLRARVLDDTGMPVVASKIGQALTLEVEFESKERIPALVIGLAIHGLGGEALFATHWNDQGQTHDLNPGRWRTRCRLSPNYLRPGTYLVSLGATTGTQLCAHVPEALRLKVESVLDRDTDHYDERIGKLFIPMQWEPPASSKS